MAKNKVDKKRKRANTWVYVRNNKDLYLMLIPSMIVLLLFNFIPLLGNIIAFEDYSLFAGDGIIDSMFKSEWVGLGNFRRIFSRPDALQSIANTLIISFAKIIVLMPLPLVLAILLNEVRSALLQRLSQTVIIFPYFLSWVIVAALFMTFMGGTGIVNDFLVKLGMERQYFFVDKSLFRALLVITEGWKEAGYGTVVYMAAIAGIAPELYEAAEVDGANRFHKILYVTLPSLASTFILLLMMKLGHVMTTGFQQVFSMYNEAVYETGDILSTYIYRMSMGKLEYGLGTAAGLFESAIGFILIISANWVCRKFTDKSMW